MDDANINSYDIIIALSSDDADNFSLCQTAKKLYNIKKTICTVFNPKNVDVFKKLGVNTVINDSYIVAGMIEHATSVDSLIEIPSV